MIKKTYEITIHENSILNKTVTISVGCFDHAEYTYDELAQHVCDFCNAKLKINPSDTWFGHAILKQTSILDNYRFALALIQTRKGSIIEQEKAVIWLKR